MNSTECKPREESATMVTPASAASVNSDHNAGGAPAIISVSPDITG